MKSGNPDRVKPWNQENGEIKHAQSPSTPPRVRRVLGTRATDNLAWLTQRCCAPRHPRVAPKAERLAPAHPRLDVPLNVPSGAITARLSFWRVLRSCRAEELGAWRDPSALLLRSNEISPATLRQPQSYPAVGAN